MEIRLRDMNVFRDEREEERIEKKGDKDDRMRYKGNSTTGRKYISDEEEE